VHLLRPISRVAASVALQLRPAASWARR